jgi:hypothetical protein
MDAFNADLNRVLKYTTKDATILRQQLATDPEHLKAGSTLRLIAADAHDEAGDKEFAQYLRSEHPLGVEGRHLLRSSLRLHRLLTTIHDRHRQNRSYDGYETGENTQRRLNDPLNEEAAKELEKFDRDHEAAILRSPNPVAYRDGLLRADWPHFVWPGGTPIVYFTADNSQLCPKCRNGGNDCGAPYATDERHDRSDRVVGYGGHEEGPPIYCDHCNTPIESAYGDPDAPEDE